METKPILRVAAQHICNDVRQPRAEKIVVKPSALVVFLFGVFATTAAAQESCLAVGTLLQLDHDWETALLESDVGALTRLLADDFVWVHDHAAGTDTKTSLLERASDPSRGAVGHPRSRISSDVEARVVGSTGVVTGFTAVDRGAGVTTYHFMRTYVEISGRCRLLANQTMAIPE